MIRNRNGYWMSPSFHALYAPDDGSGTGGAGADAGTDGGAAGADGTDAGKGVDAGDNGSGNDPTEALNAEIARLKAEMAKQKSALDAATSEAGKYRKELKSKMTQEQIAESEKQEAAEKAAKELEALRREVAKGKTVKNVMGKLGINEDDAGELAEHLYGAENIETALLLIQKAWTAREKALRIEFGKVPPPGAGGANGEDAETQRALELAKRLGQNRAANNKSIQDGLSGYIR